MLIEYRCSPIANIKGSLLLYLLVKGNICIWEEWLFNSCYSKEGMFSLKYLWLDYLYGPFNMSPLTHCPILNVHLFESWVGYNGFKIGLMDIDLHIRIEGLSFLVTVRCSSCISLFWLQWKRKRATRHVLSPWF